MKINSLTPIIYTNNILETIEFYEKVLSFKCVVHEPEIGWACLKLDITEIMLSKPNDKTAFEKSFFTGSFYFNFSDVRELWEELKDMVKVCYPLEKFDYGMLEFAIYDNNGYLLQFGQNFD